MTRMVQEESVDGLAFMGTLVAVWQTTFRRKKIYNEALGGTGNRNAGEANYRPLTQVDYDPVNNPLVRHAVLFRSYYALSAVNVAVAEVMVNGVPTIVIASSGGATHSEEKLLLYLQSLVAAGQTVSVTSLYSERQPCNGRENGKDCEHRLAQSPLLAKDCAITYSFKYDVAFDKPTQEAEEKRFTEARERVAASDDWVERAGEEHGSGDPPVTHILSTDDPNLFTFTASEQYDPRETSRDPDDPNFRREGAAFDAVDIMEQDRQRIVRG